MWCTSPDTSSVVPNLALTRSADFFETPLSSIMNCKQPVNMTIYHTERKTYTAVWMSD